MSDNKMDFTTGGIFQKLIGFMLPILGALVLQTMYGAVDILVVDGSVRRRVSLRYQPEAALLIW